MDTESGSNIHFVCLRDEAWKIVEQYPRFWLSNCGCRESTGSCGRSRTDICLDFQERNTGGGSGLREVGLDEVARVFAEARDKHLVVRPFRDDEDRTRVAGICFCCDDCCAYFRDPDEQCDKGNHIESTAFDGCTHCGECVTFCYFGARTMVEGELTVDRGKCYGCGLCVDVCPAGCLTMVSRGSV